MKIPSHRKLCTYAPCFSKPIVGRDGLYNSYAFIWFEYKGKAYCPKTDSQQKSDVKQFKYVLSCLDHKPLRPKEREALELLQREGLISKEQRQLLRLDNEIKEVEKVRRDMHLFRLKRNLW